MTAYTTLSDVYDKLMSDVPYDDWADYILKLMAHCGAPDDADILDVGCGTGSIAVRLAKFGFDVTGLDIAPDMLRMAEEKARKNGVNVPFICQDIKKMDLHKKVDVISASCDVVNYISPDDTPAFFGAAFKNLKPGGILLFDISSDFKLREVLGNNIFFEERDELTYIWVNHLKDCQLTMDITLFKQKGDLFARSVETHMQYVHSVIKLKKQMADVGFGAIKTFECFGFTAPTMTSDRIQFAAIKEN